LPYESGGFLGFFTNEKEVVNEIAFIVLPKTLGQATVQYEVTGTERKEIIETGDWHDNAPTGCRSFGHALAAEGKGFDADSPHVGRYSRNSYGERRGMTTRDADVFMVICVSRDVSDENDQTEPYRYKIVEYWDEPTRTSTIKEQKVDWRAESKVSIGNNVDNLLVTFTDFSGRETKHTPSNNPRAPYGQVSFDDSGIVVLRPVIPTYLPAL